MQSLKKINLMNSEADGQSKAEENLLNATADQITINSLNDDCLIHIFHYLTIVEKIKIESVCKNWNRVSKLSWNHVKSLKFSRVVTYRYNKKNDETLKEKNTIYVRKILERCGVYLNELCINAYDLIDFMLSPLIWMDILENCHNIIKLSVREVWQRLIFEEYLESLFSRNPRINSISLSDLNVTGKCLLNLDFNRINHLSLFDCKFDSKENLNTFLSNLKNLNSIHLKDDFNNVTQMIEALIMSESKNILEIDVRLEKTSSLDNLLLFLENEKKVEKISLRNVSISQNLLDNVRMECLEEFNLELSKLSSQTDIFNFSKFFSRNKKLRKVKLENIFVSKFIISSLTTTILDELYMEFSKIQSAESLFNLSLLLQVRKLNLFNVLIDEKIIDSKNDLSPLASLEELAMNFNDIPTIQSEEKLLCLANFLSKQHNLRKFQCHELDINEKVMTSLPNEHLEELDLDFSKKENVENILKSLGRFQKLKTFKASFWILNTDSSQILFESINKDIKKMEIHTYDFLLPSDKVCSFSRLQNLESFDINNSEQVRLEIDTLLKNLSQCRNLKYLYIDHCLFTNAGLAGLVNLNILHVSFSINKNETFVEFIENLIYLKELRIENCKFVTEDLIKKASEVKTKRGDTHILKIEFENDFFYSNYPKLSNSPLVIAVWK